MGWKGVEKFFQKKSEDQKESKSPSLKRFGLAVYGLGGLHLLLHSYSTPGMYNVKISFFRLVKRGLAFIVL